MLALSYSFQLPENLTPKFYGLQNSPFPLTHQIHPTQVPNQWWRKSKQIGINESNEVELILKWAEIIRNELELFRIEPKLIINELEVLKNTLLRYALCSVFCICQKYYCSSTLNIRIHVLFNSVFVSKKPQKKLKSIMWIHPPNYRNFCCTLLKYSWP